MNESEDLDLTKLGLNEELMQFVKDELAEDEAIMGRPASVREYVGWLIRSARGAKIREHVMQLIAEANESGLAVPATPEYWSAMLPLPAPRALLEMEKEGFEVYCRPTVAQDLVALAGEIAPNDRSAANRFMCDVIRKIRAISRKPEGTSMAVLRCPELTLVPVGRTVARIVYRIVPELASIEILRILHRDREQVLVKTIDSSLD
jgi:plasmid stabilization system protein ParE